MQGMYGTTGIPPVVPRSSVVVGLICVAELMEEWCRVSVTSPIDAATDTLVVRALDYGGYYTVKPEQLMQIREDYLQLPFQVRRGGSLVLNKQVNLGPIATLVNSRWKVASMIPIVVAQTFSGQRTSTKASIKRTDASYQS